MPQYRPIDMAQAYERFRSLHLHHEAVTEQDLIRPVLELIVRKANARHLRDSLRAARNGGAQPRELSED